jgi:uncharacterized protein HemX
MRLNFYKIYLLHSTETPVICVTFKNHFKSKKISFMKKHFILIFLVLFLTKATSTYAQVDSSQLAKSQRQIEKDTKDAGRLQHKINKKQRKIERQERKLRRKENRRNRKMKSINKEEKKVEKIKEQE